MDPSRLETIPQQPLGAAVALKFLPEQAARNQRMLERFHGEVRLARQVSHPNVCRVYDIGEAEGLPYISMEFIDGEVLASLLRRIGRLPAGWAFWRSLGQRSLGQRSLGQRHLLVRGDAVP